MTELSCFLHPLCFQVIGRAYERMGNALAKLERLDEAIKAYNDSLVEFRYRTFLSLLCDGSGIRSGYQGVQRFVCGVQVLARSCRFDEAVKAYDYLLVENRYLRILVVVMRRIRHTTTRL